MQQLKNILVCIALLSVSILCVSASYNLTTVTKHLSATLMEADTTITKVNSELDEVHRLTLELALTSETVRKTSIKESVYIDQLNRQVTQVIRNLNDTLVTTTNNETEVATAATQTIQQIQPVLSSANSEMQALQVATHSLNTLVTDPHLTATIANVDSTTNHLNGTSKDVQSYVHSILHPTWAHKLFSWTLAVVHAVNPL